MNSRTRHSSPAASSSKTRICCSYVRALKSAVLVKLYTFLMCSRDGRQRAAGEAVLCAGEGVEEAAAGEKGIAPLEVVEAGGEVGLVAGEAEEAAGDTEAD